MPYVTLLEASQIVKNETGIDITVPQLIRAGAMQHLMLCVLLDVKCYSPTHRIRREKRALELDPDYWSNCPIDRIDDADVVDAYGLFVLPPRHVFAYQTKETVRVDSVASLDGLDIYFPGVYVSRDALQITMPHLDAFINHIKATQATGSRIEAATAPADGAMTSRIHSTRQTSRRDVLTPVIEHAQSLCKDPSDDAEVWAQLLVLAQGKHPPLLGSTEDGLQVLDWDERYFKRADLRKRMQRQKPAA